MRGGEASGGEDGWESPSSGSRSSSGSEDEEREWVSLSCRCWARGPSRPAAAGAAAHLAEPAGVDLAAHPPLTPTLQNKLCQACGEVEGMQGALRCGWCPNQ